MTDTPSVDDTPLDTPQPASAFSFRRGIRFLCRDGEREIDVWGSTWTGREIIRVNGDEMVNARSLSLRSNQVFDYAGDRYEVLWGLKTLGSIECLILKNNHLIFRGLGKQTAKRRWPMIMLLFFMGGMAGGFAAYHLFKLLGGS
ncbi:hypothetical protein [Yunchengibacter salinarum]|uniref:hypothetical protein n=1 Tax=Yunchengibacter salinarum TaxID=3133399 RepID=UPI0035B5A5E7